MTDRAMQLSDKMHIAVSVTTLISLLATAVWLGRKWERIEQHCQQAWMVADQVQWVYQTQVQNKDWIGAAPYTIKQRP